MIYAAAYVSFIFLIAAFWSCYWSGWHSGAAHAYSEARKDLPQLLSTAEQSGAIKVVREVKKIVADVADERLRTALTESLFGGKDGTSNKNGLH